MAVVPAHDHAHGHVHPSATPRSIRLGIAVLACAAVLTAVGMALLWPRDADRLTGAGNNLVRADATVLAVRTAPCPSGGGTCKFATVRLDDGPDAGRAVQAEVASGPGAPRVRAGEAVVVSYEPDAAPRRYEVTDHQRGIQLWILVLAFAAAIVAFGRLRGFTALIGLGATFAVLLTFIVPAILAGRSPLLVAVVGSAAIMLIVLYLTHGFTTATSVAVVGTLSSLTLTGVLAAVATNAAYLTGVADDETVYLSVSYGNVDMRGLLLAGILIGSLGVLDDIAVTQAATVEELATANPTLTASQLYRSATRIGRAHIASVVNTIILAAALATRRTVTDRAPAGRHAVDNI